LEKEDEDEEEEEEEEDDDEDEDDEEEGAPSSAGISSIAAGRPRKAKSTEAQHRVKRATTRRGRAHLAELTARAEACVGSTHWH
jgi:hypothetical protein